MDGRKTGTLGASKAAQYISHRYAQISLKQVLDFDAYFQHFSYRKNKRGVNLVGMFKGGTEPEKFIVVSAHYDHIGHKGKRIFNGADDNASGVAVMLALAEKVSQAGSKHSIIFLASDAEEQGLYGAKAFLANTSLDIVNNLNLDMLARVGNRNRLYVLVSKANRHVYRKIKGLSPLCVRKFKRKSSTFAHSQINWRQASDHGAFARKGIPFVYLGVGMHKDYHGAEDIWQNITKEDFFAAAETSWMALKELDTLNQ